LGDEFLEVLQVDTTNTWITPYKRYLTDGLLPTEPLEARIVKRNAERYTLIEGNLFCHGYTHPILTCVIGDQCAHMMEIKKKRILNGGRGHPPKHLKFFLLVF